MLHFSGFKCVNHSLWFLLCNAQYFCPFSRYMENGIPYCALMDLGNALSLSRYFDVKILLLISILFLQKLKNALNNMYKIKTIWLLPKHYIASEVTPNAIGEVKSNLPWTLKKPFLSFFFQNFAQMWRKKIATYLPGFDKKMLLNFKK
jgi:hypothetical protein